MYVPIDNTVPAPVSEAPIDLKDWADIELCDELFRSIQTDLMKVYDQRDTMKIYCISVLRVCNTGIHDWELKEAY